MRPEDTIDFHLRWAWTKLSKMYNSEAAKFGGSMAVGFALLNIDKSGTPSTKLGPKMGMESTSLTRLLKTMERDGLIRKETSENDKRVVLVQLTEKGKKMRDKSRAHVIAFNKAVSAKISKQKLEIFMDVIKRLNTIVETNNIFEKTGE